MFEGVDPKLIMAALGSAFLNTDTGKSIMDDKINRTLKTKSTLAKKEAEYNDYMKEGYPNYKSLKDIDIEQGTTRGGPFGPPASMSATPSRYVDIQELINSIFR